MYAMRCAISILKMPFFLHDGNEVKGGEGLSSSKFRYDLIHQVQ